MVGTTLQTFFGGHATSRAIAITSFEVLHLLEEGASGEEWFCDTVRNLEPGNRDVFSPWEEGTRTAKNYRMHGAGYGSFHRHKDTVRWLGSLVRQPGVFSDTADIRWGAGRGRGVN